MERLIHAFTSPKPSRLEQHEVGVLSDVLLSAMSGLA
jgi:hypothetical protein